MSLQESCLSKGIQHCGYHICVLGCIGAGKSTLAEAMQKVIEREEGQCFGLYEPVGDNPHLPMYYKDPKRYALDMQIYMLNKRYEQQMLAEDLARNGISSVQDSSLFGDSCFVEMLKKDGIMSELQCELYAELFHNMTYRVMYPSLVVYLDCPVEIARNRIAHRGRECEKEISLDYLSKLKAELDIFVNDFERYTFVKHINASVDMNQDEINLLAENIYTEVKLMRNKPIISRMGV